MVLCTSCGFVLEQDQVICPSCGIERPGRFSKVSYIDGELIEYGSQHDGRPTYSRAEKQNWYLAFVWYGTRHNFKNPKGWAYHAYVYKFTDKSDWAWRNLQPVTPTEEQSRWIKHYLIKSRKRYEKAKKNDGKLACPACRSERFIVTSGAGPHAAGKRCADCGKHLGWVSKVEANAMKSPNLGKSR